MNVFRNSITLESYLVRRIVSLLVLLIQLRAETTFTGEFAIEGRMSYEVLSLRGDVLVLQESAFQFIVQDCKWYLKKVPTLFLKRGVEQALRNYSIVSSDATNFYQLSSFETIVEAAKQAGNVYSGRVGAGTYPYGLSDPAMIVLWYAYGSACYFANLEQPYLNPPDLFTNEEPYAKDFRVLAKWQLHDAPPFLPQRISFDGVPRFEVKSSTVSSETWHFTRCAFNALTFTNANGAEVPRTLSVQYFNKHPLRPSELFPSSRLSISVTNCPSSVPAVNFRPAIPGQAVVSDLRTISPSTPFGVAVMSQDWPTQGYSKRIAQLRAETLGRLNTHNIKSKVATVLLVLLLILPFVVMAIKRWK